ncbi:seryl-tRNA synthetase [Ignicoccus pacificus DSM 13166]|uniref:Serine--tRNA ligase n=1 Tax=Ignicoccus pacificus DSM 13166 TaxID=940294 RepID=A0A977PK01_9CREN|nr:seryl-tRNA synthetase [Ignicoccus pacificus DSM 13166]
MPWSLLEALRNEPEKLIRSMKKRCLDPAPVYKAIEIDKEWRRVLQEVERLRYEHNKITREIAKTKDPELRKELIAKAKEIIKKREEMEKKLKELEKKREEILLSLPNLVHESVPDGCDEEYNVPIRFWGTPKVWKGHLESFKRQTERWGFQVPHEVLEEKPIGHADMLENVLKMGDTFKAAQVATSRFYYLFKDIVWLDYALIMYALDNLTKKGFIPVEPPYMIRYKYLMGVIDIETFKDAIYKIENEDLYLIATAEHPLASYKAGEIIDEKDLPIKFAGVSPCFRKEAGAANRDLKGIFRVHQFHKVEQFVYSKPEESWEILEELIKNAEELIKGLELPYRVVNICGGELGYPAAKKYDLEVWYPAQGRYRELVSASNCTDWQSYRLKIRYRIKGGKKHDYVHLLNSTALATTRTITAILENHQLPDGRVEIPKVLRKYLEPFESAPKEYIEPLEKKP